jgi:uridine kinase
MVHARPDILGIAGGSGSGKTTLAESLGVALPVDEVVILPLDAYYRDLSHLSQAARRQQNFDAPEAIDWALFAAHLRSLSRACQIDRPVYDFTSHTRQPDTTTLEPRPLVIVEGVLLLCREDIRALIHTSVFLDVDDQTAVERRLTRDRRERGRRADDIRTQFARDVQPMFEQHVRPTRRWATLTLSGTAQVAVNVDCVLKALGRERAPDSDRVWSRSEVTRWMKL